ncbi:MAG: radical SAM protein [Eggerthellaceae bacterium]|nr:radical SAM protein [Eggerthellaceae bacterium]
MEGCALCPRGCDVVRAAGEIGACGAGDELVVAHTMLHQWEEPPISCGAGSGAVFFAGCPLGCVYCQNSAISRRVEGEAVTPHELSQTFLKLQGEGAANINLVTPTHFANGIRDAIGMARDGGLDLPVIWNTSGYEASDAIRANEGFVDAYLTDFKYADADLSRRLSFAPDYPQVALSAIEEMVRAVGKPAFDELAGEPRLVSGVVVRHLVLPGCIPQSKEALRILREAFGDSILLSVMGQYTPVLPKGSPCLRDIPELARALEPSEYEEVLEFADELGYEDYFWQDGDAAKESFIPQFYS